MQAQMKAGAQAEVEAEKRITTVPTQALKGQWGSKL